METIGRVLLYRDKNYKPTVVSAWAIERTELAPNSAQILSLLNASCTNRLNEQAAWIHHAIQEFQDLQRMPLGKAPFPNNSNYLFHEGIQVLRESVLTSF
jgi:hypothetical protein